jgi:hypothetical protein
MRLRPPIFLLVAAALLLAAPSRPAGAIEIASEMREGGLLLRVPGIYWEFSVERSEDAEGFYTYLGYRYIGCTESCEYLDPEVEGGATYWYRLRLMAQDGSTIQAGPTPVTIPGRAGGILRASCAPNPCVEGVRIGFRVPPSAAPEGSARVEVSLLDVTGRMVRAWSLGERGAGPHEVLWDGRGASNEPVASGVYFVRIRAGRAAETIRLLKLR